MSLPSEDGRLSRRQTQRELHVMVTTQERVNKSDEGQERVARHCLAHHPMIEVGPGLESIPHITGTDLTVTEILSRLYVHGSFKAIADFYGDITEDQIKEAVSYTLIYM